MGSGIGIPGRIAWIIQEMPAALIPLVSWYNHTGVPELPLAN